MWILCHSLHFYFESPATVSNVMLPALGSLLCWNTVSFFVVVHQSFGKHNHKASYVYNIIIFNKTKIYLWHLIRNQGHITFLWPIFTVFFLERFIKKYKSKLLSVKNFHMLVHYRSHSIFCVIVICKCVTETLKNGLF